MAAEYSLTLDDYLAILRRRAVLLAGVFGGLFAAALLVAVAIPPTYRSTGTIMVESQQIPQDFVQSPGGTFIDERIEVIKQRVMTRENLVAIISKYGLFRDGPESLTVSKRVDEMRSKINVELIGANVRGNRWERATIAFRLSFENRDPDVAHRVASELVTLFLDENVKVRTARAVETTAFLAEEADKLRAELEVLETQLATYKQQHGNALPEHLELRMNMVSRTEAELREVERDHKSAQEELRFLDLELTSAKAGLSPRTGAGAAGPVLSPAQELDRLKAEYAKASAIYTEAHPDVRALRRKIDALEAAGSAPPPSDTDAVGRDEASLAVAKVQAKIAATTDRISSLAAQMRTLRGNLATFERQIIQTPQVERALVTLMRDHESAKTKYEEIRSKQMTARIAENLEEDNKAERFALLEPPLRPDKPIRPNRPKIILIGLFLALGGSGGLVFLLEMLNQRIRGADALSLVMHQRPLVVIPYITTQAEIARRKGRIKTAAVVLLLVSVASLGLVHLLYMPLDILVLKIIARFG